MLASMQGNNSQLSTELQAAENEVEELTQQLHLTEVTSMELHNLVERQEAEKQDMHQQLQELLQKKEQEESKNNLLTEQLNEISGEVESIYFVLLCFIDKRSNHRSWFNQANSKNW